VSGRNGPAWTPLEQVVTKELLRSEVLAWARRVGVEPKEVRIRPMSRKWGSCSTAGRLTLDSGLADEPAEFRREVIVHEFVHLKVPNHGPLFRALLRAYLGKSEVMLARRGARSSRR
jgi:predicted metal-dependent hydrolase